MAQSGSLLLLKLQDDEGNFNAICGMKTTKLTLNNNIIDISNKSTGKWRQLMGEVGISAVSISGSGIFINSTTAESLREIAFLGQIKPYQLSFANGDILSGSFYITHYECSGNYAEEENYNLTLESAGIISFAKTPVP